MKVTLLPAVTVTLAGWVVIFGLVPMVSVAVSLSTEPAALVTVQAHEEIVQVHHVFKQFVDLL